MDKFIHLPFRRIDRKLYAVYSGVYHLPNSFRSRQGSVGSQINICIANILCQLHILRQFKHDKGFSGRVHSYFPCPQLIGLTQGALHHFGTHLPYLALHLLVGAKQALVVTGIGQLQQEIGVGKGWLQTVQLAALRFLQGYSLL